MVKRIMVKRIRSVFLLSVLLIGLGAGIALVKRQQDLRSRAQITNVNLFISPDTRNVAFLEEFSLDVFIDADTNQVSAVELEITYEESLLEGVSIEGRDFLPVVLDQGEIATGNASITLGSNPDEPKDGTGLIATLTFKAKELSGDTIVQIDEETEVAALQQEENMAGDLSSSTVSIITPTPTTTPPPTSTPPPTLAGDINGDGVVNILDFQILSNNFGTNYPDADLNGDSIVNILDFQILSNNFGKT